MKKLIFCFLFIFSLNIYLFSDEIGISLLPPPPHRAYTQPKLRLIFHSIGRNMLHSFTYNFGSNFIGAGLGTWAFIENGIDWRWRNIAYNNSWLSNLGRPGLYIGYIVPGLTPILTYAIGRVRSDEKLQIAGIALTQTLMLTLAVQTPLKMITGRALPGIVADLDHTRNSQTANFSNEFNWFNCNSIGGWPSGHTANAFAAAATLSEIYNDNFWLKIGIFSYASLIGLGVTLNVHWASEALAGALIGYAIGKTVGRSFRKFLGDDEKYNYPFFYFTPNGIGVIIKF